MSIVSDFEATRGRRGAARTLASGCCLSLRLARPAKTRGAGAGLPACTPYAAALHSFCESLRTDAARYLSALRRAGAIDGALLITVDRVTGAARAHRGSALSTGPSCNLAALPLPRGRLGRARRGAGDRQARLRRGPRTQPHRCPDRRGHRQSARGARPAPHLPAGPRTPDRRTGARRSHQRARRPRRLAARVVWPRSQFRH